MISSIELQVISRILTTDSIEEINTLCAYDSSYYAVFKDHISFILDHKNKYDDVPDVFTFEAKFPDVVLLKVTEPIQFLTTELRKNKQHIMLIETFNKLKDLNTEDASDAWKYLQMQCDKVAELESVQPMDIVHDAKERSNQVLEYSQQSRIPTGFAEIDQLMYGGLSTVEELLLIVARTNTGKSWVCTKMMESAQKNGFPVLYYSPEMQASFLGTRFDTWRAHFKNSSLYQGKYNAEYLEYIKQLSKEETPAFVLEDKDMPEGEVTVAGLETLVRRHGIKLIIIDGLSYMSDSHRADTEYIKYKNICSDLFKLSKRYGCAVVVALQANRETRSMVDDKGEPFPNLYAIEGSDHPGRICTQAFSMRQIFDKHVLDIRLEKSRIANNQKPILSYAWDPNTGSMRYLPGEDEEPWQSNTNTISSPLQSSQENSEDDMLLDDDDDFDDVEF